jgi:cation:H+ antiporter
MRAMLLIADALAWTSDYPIAALLAGLALLVIGAEVLVRGAVWIALAVGMSRMAVGLTLVSIGTSLPELLVTLTAADGHADLGLGNVLGSNVANVLLIIGVAATIRAIRTSTRWLELGYMLLMTALAGVPFVVGSRLDRWLSGLMAAALIVFLYQLLARERIARKLLEEDVRPKTTLAGWLVNVLFLVAGFAMLKFGADWLVGGASQVAADMGMSQAVIGVTVVAIGTSMPELVTSAIAALRGQPEICIGNVVGSNIFNVGAVLGGAGLLHPFAFTSDPLLMATVVLAGISALALTFSLRKIKGVSRGVGVLFLLAYVGYVAYAVIAKSVG